MVELARKTFRTGVQALWRNQDGDYFVTIKNRTYKSWAQIPEERVQEWLKRLR